MNNFKESQQFIRQADLVTVDNRGMLTFHHFDGRRVRRNSPVTDQELSTFTTPQYADMLTFRMMFMGDKN